MLSCLFILCNTKWSCLFILFWTFSKTYLFCFELFQKTLLFFLKFSKLIYFSSKYVGLWRGWTPLLSVKSSFDVVFPGRLRLCESSWVPSVVLKWWIRIEFLKKVLDVPFSWLTQLLYYDAFRGFFCVTGSSSAGYVHNFAVLCLFRGFSEFQVVVQQVIHNLAV
jgi:hypothetical protein